MCSVQSLELESEITVEPVFGSTDYDLIAIHPVVMCANPDPSP